ncbi:MULTISPECIES: hypothetical protein [Paracoccus]|uniref:hypothetical protein n=1 Tax=Paracoccus TaxID=265 RepID=UPI001E351AB2|nr:MULTISPECIES: hypothetical protein [Paracoccus]
MLNIRVCGLSIDYTRTPRFPRGFLRLTRRRAHNLMHRQTAGQTQQARQSAVKMDGQPGLTIATVFRRDRHQLHLVDQCSQRLLRLVHPLGLRQARDQRADPGAVGLCHARVDPDRVRGWGGRELAF